MAIPYFQPVTPASFDANGALNALMAGRQTGMQDRSRSSALSMGNALAGGDYNGAMAAAAQSGDPNMVLQAQQAGQSAQNFGWDMQTRRLQALGNAASLADTPEKWSRLVAGSEAAGLAVPDAYRDFEAGRPLLMGRIGNINGDLNRQMLTAQTGLAGVQVQQAQLAMQQMRQQMGLRQGLYGEYFPELFGGQGTPGGAPAGAQPSRPQAAPANALMMPQTAPGPWAQGQAPAFGSNVQGAAPAARPVPVPQVSGGPSVGGTLPSTASQSTAPQTPGMLNRASLPPLPGAGAATGFTGFSPDSMRQALSAQMLGLDPSAMSQMPEARGRAKYAETVGDLTAHNEQDQLTGMQVLKLYDEMERTAKSDPSALAWAIGPQNAGNGVHVPLVGDVNLRSAASAIGRSTVGALSNAVGANYKGQPFTGDPYAASNAMRAQLETLRAGITNLASSGGTDSRLSTVAQEVGSMLDSARDPETFFRMLELSKANARSLFKLPPDAGYTNQYPDSAPGAGAAPAPGSAPTMDYLKQKYGIK
jgi:hypothetical protein